MMESYRNMHSDYSGPGGEFGSGPDYQAPRYSIITPPKSRWGMILAAATTIIVLAIATIIIVLVATDDDEVDPGTPFPGKRPGDVGAISGEVLTRDKAEFTTSGLSEKTLDDGKRALCSTVSVANHSDKSYHLSVYHWSLQYPSMRSEEVNTTISDPSAYKGILSTGAITSGELCFDRPAKESGTYVLLYEASTWKGQRLGWVDNR